MCGIVCYNGKKQALDLVLEGLEKLEYRGYDSSGVSILKDEITTIKKAGKIETLLKEIEKSSLDLNSKICIGHTRWATHGVPTDINAHPHNSMDNSISIVHNGIIENYLSIKDELNKKGIEFKSDTDSEVIAQALGKYYEKDLLTSVFKVRDMLEGAYALGIISSKDPGVLIGLRNEAPLIAGICDDGVILASDITSIIEFTKKVIYLENGDLIYIKDGQYKIYDKNKNIVQREIKEINWTFEAASKEGYEHFMIKEIHEQPQMVKDAISLRISNGLIKLTNSFTKEEIENFSNIYIVACGTAFHAGEVGKYLLEKYLKRPVFAEIASEFRYNDPFIDENSLLIVVSQSGETADTLAAIKETKRKGGKVLAITNVVGSSIDREADKVMYCYAGPEISVASTKAYTAQVIALYFLTLDFAYKTGKISKEELKEFLDEMRNLPKYIDEILDREDVFKSIAQEIKDSLSSFYIGRGLDYLSAKEGALKLKEVTYIHVESFAAGELKHGSLALIEDGTPAFAVATQKRLLEKTQSNIKEISARGGHVYGIGVHDEHELLKKACKNVFYLPETKEDLMPILSVIPMQLLAYYTSLAKGIDVDKPRNLAKSVTVE